MKTRLRCNSPASRNFTIFDISKKNDRDKIIAKHKNINSLDPPENDLVRVFQTPASIGFGVVAHKTIKKRVCVDFVTANGRSAWHILITQYHNSVYINKMCMKLSTAIYHLYDKRGWVDAYLPISEPVVKKQTSEFPRPDHKQTKNCTNQDLEIIQPRMSDTTACEIMREIIDDYDIDIMNILAALKRGIPIAAFLVLEEQSDCLQIILKKISAPDDKIAFINATPTG